HHSGLRPLRYVRVSDRWRVEQGSRALHGKWMCWMRACIFNSSMSVLVNGRPTEDFNVGKGLRQGDPLSPFLILIATEGLSGMVNKAVQTRGDKNLGKPIVESMTKRLSSWSGRNLSIGGRVTLINSVYGPLSSKFLSWEAVATNTKDSLWWRDVVGVGGKDGDCWFPLNLSSILGNGDSICFWKEKWFGAAPLRDLFPHLYDKDLHKDCMVSDLIHAGTSVLHWNSDWVDTLSQEEAAEMADLEQLLTGLDRHVDREDR
ncbi:ribonuclease H, partial [Trifolium pratense]